MHLVFQSLWPIASALLIGLFLGRRWPRLVRWTPSILKRLIVLLLFCCGREFSNILQLGPALGHILKIAATYAVLTTAASWLLILRCQGQTERRGAKPKAPARPGQWRRALADCLCALGTVVAGVIVGQIEWPVLDLIGSHQLIIVMVLLIGVELVEVPLAQVWKDRQAWAVPGLVVIGSIVGGAAAALWTGQPIGTGLAIASGFGWVTLSSIMVGDALGEAYGAMTMASDMFRELMAISALYLFGDRLRAPAIGICGATALDATLPLIRTQCGQDAVPLALLSGLALTLASPVFIVILLGAGAGP